MAFTRKAIAAIEGLTSDQIDKIMTLHGTSMADYMLKSEMDSKIKEQLGDLDINTLKSQAGKASQLEQEINKIKLSYAAEKFVEGMKPKDALAKKAALSEMLEQNFKFDAEKNEFTGAADWAKKFQEGNAQHFGDKSVFTAFGQRQGDPILTKTEEQAYLDNKYKNNPYYNK